ncbi:hypothetical protein KR215_008978, partial [Drosophila sulfurigaster]
VLAVMRKLQVFIGWFQALNGITEYYPDAQTGSLKRSKYLKFYIIFHNLLTLFGTSLLFNDLHAKRSSAVYAVHSHWITYAAIFYTIVKILVVFLTLHSVLAQRKHIHSIISKLQKLDSTNFSRSDRIKLGVLQYIKLSAHFYNIMLYINKFYLQWDHLTVITVLFYCYGIWCHTKVCAMTLLLFEILWKIHHVGIGLQSQLEMLLAQRVQILKLRRVFMQHQQFINVCNEYCANFPHFLVWYPLKNICIVILAAYYLLREKFANESALYMDVTTIIFISAFTMHLIAEIYVINSLSEAIADFIPDTISLLWQSKHQDHRVELAIIWMKLQLCCQSTDIQLFGVVTLNKRLSFIVVAETVLNTICMIQSDYYYLK